MSSLYPSISAAGESDDSLNPSDWSYSDSASSPGSLSVSRSLTASPTPSTSSSNDGSASSTSSWCPHCDFIPKNRRSSSELKRHIKVHVPLADRDRFVCPYPGCEAKFSRKDAMQLHQKKLGIHDKIGKSRKASKRKGEKGKNAKGKKGAKA